MKLNAFISHSGVCSRRKAVDCIKNGDVAVNGVIVKESYYEVAKDDIVCYKGTDLFLEKKIYILINKPSNYITTVSDEKGRKTVVQLVPERIRQRLYPVGRLDRSTTGLLILTNDGDLAQKLSHPRHEVSKTYHVTLDKACSSVHFKDLKQGIKLEDGPVVIDELAYDGALKKKLFVTLHSGRNRIIRRMFEHFDYKVEKLDRTGYAGLTKRGLRCGLWRHLTGNEVQELKKIRPKKGRAK